MAPCAIQTPDQPPQSRRRIPLSLRIFAVNVFLFCVGTALWIGVQVSRRHSAIREFERAGGRCKQIWSRDCLLPSGIPDLRSSTFLPVDRIEVRTGLSDSDLANMSELTDAVSLFLEAENVTDFGMAHFRAMVELRRLNICCPNLSDAGMVPLAGLTNLEQLSLDSPHITDRGLQSLAGLTKLKWLRLRNSRVTDAGVAALQRALPGVKVEW